MNSVKKRSSSSILLRFLEYKEGAASRIVFACVMLAFILAAAARFQGRPIETDPWAMLPQGMFEGAPRQVEQLWKERTSGEDGSLVTIIAAPERTLEAKQYAALKKAFEDAAAPVLVEYSNAASLNASGSAEGMGVPVLESDLKKMEKILESDDPEKKLVKEAYACLLSSLPKPVGFRQDPFCWSSKYAAAAAAKSRFEQVSAAGRSLILVKPSEPSQAKALLMILKDADGLASDGSASVGKALAKAESALCAAAEAMNIGRVEVFAAGVPIFADAVSSQAQSELSLIGGISLAGAAAAAAAIFGSAACVAAIILAVGIGLASAFGAAWMFFPSLNLITFVFGATLIGLGVDYGAHWFIGAPACPDPIKRRRMLLPSMAAAALSTSAAYSLLILAPMPSLVEMGTAAAFGILGTFFAVAVILPRLERFAAPKSDTAFLVRLMQLLSRYPRISRSKTSFAIGAAAAAAAAAGIAQMDLGSGIKDLQGVPQELYASQKAVEERLGLPSPAQFFITSADDFEKLIDREAELRTALESDPELKDLEFSGLTDYVPSEDMARRSADVLKRAAELVNPVMSGILGASLEPEAFSPRTPELFLESAFGPLFARSYIGMIDGRHYAALRISGISPQDAPRLRAAAAKIKGAAFVDVSASLERTLTAHRDMIFVLLAAASVLIAAVLAPKYGRKTFGIMAPVFIGAACAAAFFGYAGIPITLFTALGFVLLLGLGLDYGLFLAARPDDARTSAAIMFSGLTTILSFGLLCTSSTPALSAFGWTILIGESAVLASAPLFRPRNAKCGLQA